jgi:hypothetical protein
VTIRSYGRRAKISDGEAFGTFRDPQPLATGSVAALAFSALNLIQMQELERAAPER